MGWIFSLALFFYAVCTTDYTNDPLIFIASGLFAIAGSVACFVASKK